MISVIVPVYNVEKYLEECLDSIQNQTYSDIEVTNELTLFLSTQNSSSEFMTLRRNFNNSSKLLIVVPAIKLFTSSKTKPLFSLYSS